MATNKFGKLASIEYAPDGSDVQKSLALVVAGQASAAEFATWSAERDNWLRSQAKTGPAGEVTFMHYSQADEDATKHLADDKRKHAKGTILARGINGRFPVSMHGRSWLRLLRQGAKLLTYLRSHCDELNGLSARHDGHKPYSAADVVETARGLRDELSAMLDQVEQRKAA